MAIDDPISEYPRQYRTEPRPIGFGLAALRPELYDRRGISLVNAGATVEQAVEQATAELDEAFDPDRTESL